MSTTIITHTNGGNGCCHCGIACISALNSLSLLSEMIISGFFFFGLSYSTGYYFCFDYWVFPTLCSVAAINVVLILVALCQSSTFGGPGKQARLITFVLCEVLALLINLAVVGMSANFLVNINEFNIVCPFANALSGLGAGGIIACVLHIIVIVLTCLGPARRTNILTVTQDGSTLVDVGGQSAEAYRGEAGWSASATPVALQLRPVSAMHQGPGFAMRQNSTFAMQQGSAAAAPAQYKLQLSQDDSLGFCGSCGLERGPSQRFCSRCGTGFDVDV